MKTLKISYDGVPVDALKNAIDKFNAAYMQFTGSISCDYQGTGNYPVSKDVVKFETDIAHKLSTLASRMSAHNEKVKKGIDALKAADEGAQAMVPTISVVVPSTGFKDVTVPTAVPDTPPTDTPTNPDTNPWDVPVDWYLFDTNFGNGAQNSNLADLSLGRFKNIVSNSKANPQGFAEGDNYVVVSSSDGMLYIKDKKTGTVKKISVGSHLGGLSYGKDANGNEYVYAATNNTVSRYNIADLLNGQKNPTTFITSQTTGNNKTDSVSFIGQTPGDSRMIVGQFHVTKDQSKFWQDNWGGNGGAASDLQIYDTNNPSAPPKIVHVPGEMTNLQGACIYNKNGQDYYVLTSSAGKGNPSTVYVATLDPTTNTLVKVKTHKNLPPGAEQVAVTNDGNLTLVFEGNSSRTNVAILDSNRLFDI